MTPERREKNRKYAEDRRAGKKRICPDCKTREPDKYCTYCSECRNDRILQSKAVANHNQDQTEERKLYKRNFNRQYRLNNKEKLNEYHKNNMRRRRENARS